VQKVVIGLDGEGDGQITLIDAGNNTDVLFTAGGASYINTGGNFGIGTSSPSASLEVDGVTNSTYLIVGGDDSSNGRALTFTSSASASFNGAVHTINAPSSQGVIALATGSSEAMRIDDSGNLLVGKTSDAINVAGVVNYGAGTVRASRNGNAGQFGRISTDGDIVVFYKDTVTVGSIGVVNDSLYISSPYGSDAGLRFSNSIVHPCTTAGAPRDDAIDLGYASARFDDIYATNGTIQTSDRNEKQDIEALSDAEQRVAVAAKGLLRKFRWKSSVAEKGDEARTHFGIIAQDLQAAFAAEGLDAGDYAMFINSTWTDEETGEERSRMGVRYSELLAFIIAAI
jgi:hypothetical protein